MTSMRPATPSILCVDDESRVLDGLRLTLRHGFDVLTATSGAEGLAMLKRMAGATVVISDMRMPGMDGAAFLTQVKEQWPDSTRLLLTGEAGRDAAIAAVNEGQIFRFDEALRTGKSRGSRRGGGTAARTRPPRGSCYNRPCSAASVCWLTSLRS